MTDLNVHGPFGGQITTLEPSTGWNVSVDPTDGVLVGAQPKARTSCEIFYFVMGFFIMGSICVLGLVGNSLSFAVMWPECNKSTTSFLLVVLAVVDTAVLACRFVMRSLHALVSFTGSSPSFMAVHGGWLSFLVWPLASSVTMATTWITLQVTMHRYVVVCMPHRASTLGSLKVAKLLSLAIIAFSFAFSCLRFLERELVWVPGAPYPKAPRTATYRHPLYSILYSIAFFYLLNYIIPLSMLIFFTYRLIKVTREARKKREQMTSKSRDKEDLTLTLVAVVVVFLVCQLVDPVRRVLEALLGVKGTGCYWRSYYVVFSNAVICFNSAINFVIYCIFGKRFRNSLVALVCCRKNKVAPFDNTQIPNKPTSSRSGQVTHSDRVATPSRQNIATITHTVSNLAEVT